MNHYLILHIPDISAAPDSVKLNYNKICYLNAVSDTYNKMWHSNMNL